jgi:hypothetical protein
MAEFAPVAERRIAGVKATPGDGFVCELFNVKTFLVTVLGVVAVLTRSAMAEPDGPALSAAGLAEKLSARQQDGSSLIRVKMDTAGAAKTTLQLQIKSRASSGSRDLVYQVLWPKERKGEAVLLRKSGSRISGAIFTPPETVRTLSAAQMDDALLGSALSYEDVVGDFFTWDRQEIVGTEAVGKVNCQILESKPGKGDQSAYGSVRSWIDTRRMLPLRIEKYGAGGKLARRIETTRVASDDLGRPVPANLSVRDARGVTTELDGSRIKHGMNFTNAEFTPEGLKQEPAKAED